MKTKHLGSSLEDFLKQEGTFEKTTAVALERVIAALPAKRRKKIAARSADLIAQEKARRHVRKKS
jgi:hypothetical protein